MTPEPSTYTCTVCGVVFESDDDAAAEAERQALWAQEIAAGATRADFAVICDVCFRKFMQWFTSESDIVRPG